MNQMHRAYDIPDDDLRYVLATFVVVPRWIDDYGWRKLSPARGAGEHQLLRAGTTMNISGIGDLRRVRDAHGRLRAPPLRLRQGRVRGVGGDPRPDGVLLLPARSARRCARRPCA
ncbi:hypothetical protein [Streptomyces sp. KL116D]|uniref:hypothetical protein n=1 Tax=Streptomyces sp. KL116D TaxID=3045152 RepID=UPI0035568CD6